jgi:hypothetical protein
VLCAFGFVACPPLKAKQTFNAQENWFDSHGVPMTPEEFAAKIEDLRGLIADKIADLEEEPGWGGDDGRHEVIQALDELIVQAQALSEALQLEPDSEEASGED